MDAQLRVVQRVVSLKRRPWAREEAMALITGTPFDDVMTPTVGQFTRPDGTVVARPANKTTALADWVSGLAGNDSIDGGGGKDTLIGDADNDTIHGGIGNDRIEGRDGNDRLFGDPGNDTVSGG